MGKFALVFLALLSVSPVTAFASNIVVEDSIVKCNPDTIRIVRDRLSASPEGEFGLVRDVAPSNWWSKPTVSGRAIVNCGDTPAVILSFLKRHGQVAAEALEKSRAEFQTIKEKYEVMGICESRTQAERCLSAVQALSQALDIGASQGLRLKPHTQIFVWGIDWGRNSKIAIPAMVRFDNIYNFKSETEITTAAATVKALKDNGHLVSLK